VLSNHERETAFAVSVAGEVAGAGRVEANMVPIMGGEDFAYMLAARPGAFIFVGNGESYGLHHPRYNFNDDTIPYGTSYWVRLVETAMAG
jgi:metal-dependent amidase/aminoacylase/carboxypeptidase family protein